MRLAPGDGGMNGAREWVRLPSDAGARMDGGLVSWRLCVLISIYPMMKSRAALEDSSWISINDTRSTHAWTIPFCLSV